MKLTKKLKNCRIFMGMLKNFGKKVDIRHLKYVSVLYKQN